MTVAERMGRGHVSTSAWERPSWSFADADGRLVGEGLLNFA